MHPQGLCVTPLPLRVLLRGAIHCMTQHNSSKQDVHAGMLASCWTPPHQEQSSVTKLRKGSKGVTQPRQGSNSEATADASACTFWMTTLL
eukprot:366571-Chlamydomonas_euryale.AAC.33